MSKNKQDRAIDILEAGPEKNFSVKLLGQPEKFFVTSQRMADYVEQMKPAEWREDMATARAIEEGKFKAGGYRLPVPESEQFDKKLKSKDVVTFESRKAKNIEARKRVESEGNQ